MSIFAANFTISMLLFKTMGSIFAGIWDLKCKGCTNPASLERNSLYILTPLDFKPGFSAIPILPTFSPKTSQTLDFPPSLLSPSRTFRLSGGYATFRARKKLIFLGGLHISGIIAEKFACLLWRRDYKYPSKELIQKQYGNKDSKRNCNAGYGVRNSVPKFQ